MRIGRLVGLVAVACLASLPAHAETAKASLKDASGKAVGSVQLVQMPHGVLLVASTRQVLLLDDAWGDVRIHAIPRRELIRVRRTPNAWGVTLELICERDRTYRLTGVDEERAAEVAAFLAMPSSEPTVRAG